MPQSYITPRRVEGDGQHLLVPLDAVDGQLAGGGGGLHRRRDVDQGEHGRRRQGAGERGEGAPAQDQKLHGSIRSLLNADRVLPHLYVPRPSPMRR